MNAGHPFSHPVPTLMRGNLKDDEPFVSSFVHEEFQLVSGR